MDGRLKTMWRRWQFVVVIALLATMTVTCGDDSATAVSGAGGASSGSGGGLGNGDGTEVHAFAHIEISPSALMLTSKGDSNTLSAQMIDADGKSVDANFIWSSSDESMVTVNQEGVVVAVGSLGSATIIAQADGMKSPPVVVLVAQPGPGAVLVKDQQVIDIVPVDADAPYVPGFKYWVTLSGLDEAPAAGTIMLALEEAAIAGLVVKAEPSGDNTLVTLEIAPLEELFAGLDIEQTFPLDAADILMDPAVLEEEDVTIDENGWIVFTPKEGVEAPNPNPDPPPPPDTAGDQDEPGPGENKFKLFGFTCVAKAGFPKPAGKITKKLKFENLKADVKVKLIPLPVPIFPWILPVTPVKIIISGTMEIIFVTSVTVSAAFETKINCERQLGTIPVPLAGPLSVVLSGKVPVGIGFEIGGKVELAQVGAKMTLNPRMAVKFGYDCTLPDAPFCKFHNDFASCPGDDDLCGDNGAFTFEWIYPGMDDMSILNQFRVKPYVQAYAWGKVGFAPSWLPKSLNVWKISAGLKHQGDLTFKRFQAMDDMYASNYDLGVFFKAAPVDAMEWFIKLFKITVDPFTITGSKSLFHSPMGTFTMPTEGLVAGTPVKATVEFSGCPDTVFDCSKFLFKYNIRAVHIYRMNFKADDSFKELVSVDQLVPTDKTQKTFEWWYTPTAEDLADGVTFVAFWETEFPTWQLQVWNGEDSPRVVIGEGGMGGGCQGSGFTCGGLLCDDRSGTNFGPQEYKTTPIGTQCWMAENLRVGTQKMWKQFEVMKGGNAALEKHCYDDGFSKCTSEGGLYTWYEAVQSGDDSVVKDANGNVVGICPPGWHLPSDAEWWKLESFLGMAPSAQTAQGQRGTDEGDKLKQKALCSIVDPNVCGTSGFEAQLPGYSYKNSQVQPDFVSGGTNGLFWSSTLVGNSAWTRGVNDQNGKINRGTMPFIYKNDGASVRCVWDTPVP